jgi:hypothetical protein
MWCEFQRMSGVLWIMSMTRGKVIPPAENGFITFRRLSAPFARVQPTPARLNRDDRMAADPEQLRVPPNSPRGLLRQATRFQVTLSNRYITSNTADLRRPSVTTRAHLVPGARLVPLLGRVTINPCYVCYPRSIWCGIPVECLITMRKKSVPRAMSAGHAKVLCGSPSRATNLPGRGVGRPCRCAPT